MGERGEVMEYLVIYATKYGSTRDIAEGVAKGLGQGTKIFPVQEMKALEADLVVLGCPIYSGKLLPEMIDFLAKRKEELITKKLAFFIVCGDKGSVQVQGQETGGKAYLKEINAFLEDKLIAEEAFLGRMKKSELNEEDQALLEEFSNILGVQFPDFSGVDLTEAEGFGQKIKKVINGE